MSHNGDSDASGLKGILPREETEKSPSKMALGQKRLTANRTQRRSKKITGAPVGSWNKRIVKLVVEGRLNRHVRG